MPRIDLEIWIDAPIGRCFDVARDVGLHCLSAGHTKERVVGGRMTGLLELGDTVTFEAVYFGIKQRLMSKITEFTTPNRFVDVVQESVFASVRHTHEFVDSNGGTTMRDVLEFTSPFGILGKIVDKVWLTSYMRRFLAKRNAVLKAYAEDREASVPVVMTAG
jgi:ligand-binding SRPBCC domain-containing protein